MPETKPIPVRLGDDVITRLDRASKRIGSNRASVIRFLVDSWLDHFEKHGRASLPPNWEELVNSMDNRTVESRQKIKKLSVESQNLQVPAAQIAELGMKALRERKSSKYPKTGKAVLHIENIGSPK